VSPAGVVLGFDLVSWYGALVAVALAYLLWASVLDTGHRHFQAIKRRLRPPAPESPLVVLGQPDYSFDTVTVRERRLEKRAYLTVLVVTYAIENKDAAATVTEVTTGVRRKDDGREHAFVRVKAPALTPGESASVRDFAIPKDLFDGLTDRDYYFAFLFWARFTAPGGVRWEVVFDPETTEHSRVLLDG
jgi:hypothetical protein